MSHDKPGASPSGSRPDSAFVPRRPTGSKLARLDYLITIVLDYLPGLNSTEEADMYWSTEASKNPSKHVTMQPMMHAIQVVACVMPLAVGGPTDIAAD